MTASPWATYVNDPRGTRTAETSGSATTTYTWDILQRMVARTGTTAASTATYEYRTDGMRTRKTVGTAVSGYTNTLSRHDATMPFELETLKPDGTLSSTQNVVETLEVPLLKTKHIPGSNVPNCEGSANANDNRTHPERCRDQ